MFGVRVTSFIIICLSLHWQCQWIWRCVVIVFGFSIFFLQRIDYSSGNPKTLNGLILSPHTRTFLHTQSTNFLMTIKRRKFKHSLFPRATLSLSLFHSSFLLLALRPFFCLLKSHHAHYQLFCSLNLILWNFILLTTDDISMRQRNNALATHTNTQNVLALGLPIK